MKVIITSFLIILSSFCLFAQNLDKYSSSYQKTTKTSMFILGGWASVNIATGLVGSYTTEGSNKAFHQMNLGWNSVNFGLASAGLWQLKKFNTGSSLPELLSNHHSTEKILLVNAALDVSYIGTGLFLNYRSQHLFGDAVDQSKGFGNALIMQGAFLFLFDITVFVLHKKNRLKNLEPVLLKMNW